MNSTEQRIKEKEIKKKLFLTNEERLEIEVETADETFNKAYEPEHAVSISFKCDLIDVMNVFRAHGIKCRKEK